MSVFLTRFYCAQTSHILYRGVSMRTQMKRQIQRPMRTSVFPGVLGLASGCVLGALLVKLCLMLDPALLRVCTQSAVSATSVGFLRCFALCAKFPLCLLLCCFWRRGYAISLGVLCLRGTLAAFCVGCFAATCGVSGYAAALCSLLFHFVLPLPLLLALSYLAGRIGQTPSFWRRPQRLQFAALLFLAVLTICSLCALGEWKLRPMLLRSFLPLSAE